MTTVGAGKAISLVSVCYQAKHSQKPSNWFSGTLSWLHPHFRINSGKWKRDYHLWFITTKMLQRLMINQASLKKHTGLPRWLSGEEPTCQGRRRKFITWVRKIPWRRQW